MANIEIDDKRWPLLVVAFHGNIVDHDFAAYLQRLEQNLARAERARVRTALLFDTEHGGASNATQRKMQADWVKKHFDRSAQWCVGYAFVVPSTMVRGMLQAILWLSPMPAQHRVVKTRKEAEDWLLELLAHANILSAQPKVQ